MHARRSAFDRDETRRRVEHTLAAGGAGDGTGREPVQQGDVVETQDCPGCADIRAVIAKAQG